jgi:nitroimidazol reductase NimA-like FMN-containing flavoprotein (pyridoxamine 5'-phosphate oxidase superfamily)
MTVFEPTARTRVTRAPKRAVYDRAVVDAILDEALICHLAFVHDGVPFAMPTLHARIGDVVYVHGSSASRMLRTAGGGAATASLTVTLVDGVVLARSVFNHSMNYRSVVVVGEPRLVTDPGEKLAALEAFTEGLLPGRWAEVRPPSRQELKATAVLALELSEVSAKVRTGGPNDDEADRDLPVWAGVIPLTTTCGALEADPGVPPGIEPGAHLTGWSPTSRGSSASATVASTADGENGATSSAARVA